MLQIKTPGAAGNPHAFALFRLGFRPFFLLAGLAALTLVPAWVHAFLSGRFPPTSYRNPWLWHGHEMVFGFAAAVVAGFLFTAVRNWSSQPTPRGGALAALAGLWLAGRLLPLFPDAVPAGVTALVDLAFLPLAALGIAIPIARGGARHHWAFPGVLLALAAANGAVQMQVLGAGPEVAREAVRAGVYLVVFLMALVAGLVVPSFIQRVAPRGGVSYPWVERAAPPLVLAVGAADLARLPGGVTAAVAVAACAVHLIRLGGWHHPRIWRAPLVWGLWLGYAWLVAGLGLAACAAAEWIRPDAPLHALTYGGIGGLTLAFMPRVSLGHTGRPVQAGPPLTAALALLHLGAAARVAAGLAPPPLFLALIAFSGTLWTLAFLAFCLRLAPVWWTAGYDED